MIPIGKDYYFYDGKLFKEIKPQISKGRKTPRYYITSKSGKRQWISQKQIQEIIDKRNQEVL